MELMKDYSLRKSGLRGRNGVWMQRDRGIFGLMDVRMEKARMR